MTILEHQSIAPYTTWKIGGPARWFVEAKTDEDICAAVAWAKGQQQPYRVLGAGSNTLVSDQGFAGLLILARNDHLEWQPPLVTAGAGVKNGLLIAQALQRKLGGLQWLIGVPGSVGGSVFGNAGSRDQAIGDYVVWVDAVYPDGRVERRSRAECRFGYRDSYFKHAPATILQVSLALRPIDPIKERKDLADASAAKQRSQPLAAASAGCMFKNPTVTPAEVPEELRPFVNANNTLSAWRLIAAVDLAGKKIGRMQISEQHANFLINLGGGTADQAVQLISLVKQRVRDTLNIQLQEEIQYLGF